MWSPFDCLAVAATTESGLLQRSAASTNVNANDASNITADDSFATEVELIVCAPVEFRSNNTASADLVPLNQSNQVDTTKRASDYVGRAADLQITVTTHRLVLFRTPNSGTPSTPKREARFLHLSNIFAVEVESNYFKSPKLLLSTSLGDVAVVFSKSAVKQRDECHSQLQLSLQRKQWDIDDATKHNQAMQRKVLLHRKVGVDAILSATNQRHIQAQQLTDTAFNGDAETLLQEATELVQIIHKYVATLDRESSSAASSSSDETESAADRDRLVSLLQDMGLTSALNKADYQGSAAAQAAYYDQTARQLADFLRPKLAVVPVMTLTDVYCLFNRARGSHLLSPEDLLLAVERLHELQLGLSLITFPETGLKVIRDDSKANEQVLAETFLALCNTNSSSSSEATLSHNGESSTGFVTPLSVSRQCHVSAVLALEHLQAAERAEYLVRDETMESIRFYPNQFKTWYNDDDSRTQTTVAANGKW